MDWIRTKATDSKYFNAGALSLLVAELVVLTFIIKFIPCEFIQGCNYSAMHNGVLSGGGASKLSDNSPRYTACQVEIGILMN